MSKIYLQENVYDAALERMRWVYREFKNVFVSFSGGKDSTVILNLALKVAEEMGRLPVPVQFIDQEAEWQAVIDYIRTVMHDPRVSPRWLQVPFRIFNATSTAEPWLKAWDPDKESEWMRPKEDIAIKRNVYGTDRFKELFTKYVAYHYRTQPVAALYGLRSEESPNRHLALTANETYKGVTWGRTFDANHWRRHHYLFSPIYDWSYRDVWKAIHDNGWPYCKIYDYQYQQGVAVRKMRVSNLHHETAVSTLYYLQEVEGATWERLQQRLKGINSIGHLKEHAFCPKELPPMFKTWEEYRDYLLVNLITDEASLNYFHKMFATFDANYAGSSSDLLLKMWQAQITAILRNDIYGTTMSNFATATFSKRDLDNWKVVEAAKMAELLAQADPVEAEFGFDLG